jgi:c-di-GMP-binding flagellar brake protein YcgR
MSHSNHDYSEKRDYIRMRLEAPVTLQHAEKEIPAMCLDLSSTGMQLEAECALKMGDKIKVHIASDHNQLQGLIAEAEVVRISNLDNGRQTLGLAILSMS